VLVLHVDEGQVTGDTVADALRDELLALYLQSGAIHVVLDMETVTYLSSAGIRPLLSLKRQVSQHEGRMILCNLSPDVESVFVATRLISTSRAVPATFETHPDVPAALAALYPKGESPE
jgi:anti-anti-sigma factor